MGNEHILHITCTDTHTAPILIGHAGNQVIRHFNIRAQFIHIDRFERYVRLKTAIGESSHLQSRSANVGKSATTHRRTGHRPLIVQAGGSHVSECATFKMNIVRATHGDSCFRTGYPGLILQCGFFRQSGYGEFVGIQQSESALKRHMSFIRRAIPCHMFKTHVLKPDMMHRTLQRTVHRDKSVQSRHHD